MVDDKYWQLLKRSLADQHRQYLEEVTEPMSLGFDAPEEFVTTKPSIYHSLRMQPIASLNGQVRVKPARARKLRNNENKGFQDLIRNYSLPLTTNQGESLYGRHVYPSELYSLNRDFYERHLPDVPNSYKLGWGNKDKYRRLNLYGFTGNAPMPQRHTKTTFQPEGILYGNLDENDIVQLNRKPTTAYSLAQVARAISPFHETMDVTRLGRNQQELASDIMEAGIPPILAESNVDTTGKNHALPFRIDEVSDVQEAHDPFVQWRPDSLMTSSPEGLEQFTLDNLRRSEPMDIAMRLLKKEPFYQQIRNNLIVDDGEDSPGEYPHDDFLQWAEEHYSRLHEDENHPEEYYNLLEAIELEKKRRAEGSFDGIGYNEETGFTRSEPMEIAMRLLKEEIPYSSRDYPPQEIAVSTGTPLMGSKNSGPAPEVCNMPGCESGLPPVVYRRMANPIRSIDNHEFMCEQCAYKNDMQSLLYHKMLKGEITLADFAMRLLKEEPLHLQGSNTLARRAREELETDKTGANSPAYQEMMERMMDIYEPQDETISLEDNLDQYAQETGINPWRSPPGREISNKHGGTAKVHLAPLTPIHTQPFYQWQAKNASEPMKIAMQLLKRELHPGRDIEGYLNADGHYAGEEELYNLNDPEVQNFVNRLHLDKQPPVHLIPETLGLDLGDVAPHLRVENRDTKLYHPMMMDEHENLDKFPDRKIVEREGGTKEELVSTSDPTSDVVGVGRTGRTLVSPKPTFQGIPFSEETGFTRSEPMKIAMQLLKERVSPEAKRHKLEYDKKYESSPERVKYREELNRERRRRHIMGQGGPDMSHTKDHTIVPEDAHTNRARHFKDKGTLL